MSLFDTIEKYFSFSCVAISVWSIIYCKYIDAINLFMEKFCSDRIDSMSIQL